MNKRIRYVALLSIIASSITAMEYENIIVKIRNRSNQPIAWAEASQKIETELQIENLPQHVGVNERLITLQINKNPIIILYSTDKLGQPKHAFGKYEPSGKTPKVFLTIMNNDDGTLTFTKGKPK